MRIQLRKAAYPDCVVIISIYVRHNDGTQITDVHRGTRQHVPHTRYVCSSITPRASLHYGSESSRFSTHRKRTTNYSSTSPLCPRYNPSSSYHHNATHVWYGEFLEIQFIRERNTKTKFFFFSLCISSRAFKCKLYNHLLSINI